jgi:cyclopropane fatty-acyl-phospholipid synthase-like methyltransferase
MIYRPPHFLFKMNTYLEKYGRMYLIECILIYKNVVRLDLFWNKYVFDCFMLGVIEMLVDFSCKLVLVVLSGKEKKYFPAI